MRIVRALLAIPLAFGLVLAAAAPAQAAGNKWLRADEPTKGHWRCGDTLDLTSTLSAQVCVIRAGDKISVQGAVVVHNRKAAVLRVSATVNLAATSVTCTSPEIAARSRAVCFGETVKRVDYLVAKGSVDGRELPQSKLG